MQNFTKMVQSKQDIEGKVNAFINHYTTFSAHTAVCRSTIMNSRQFLYTANWAVVSTIHYMMLQNTHYVQINSLLSLWPIKAFKGDG